MTSTRTLHVVVPEGIADPLRPSGGNTYDRRLCEALTQSGWVVHSRPVGGDAWPRPGAGELQALKRALAGIPDDEVVLVDGLLASTVPELLVPASRRVRLVVLLHMPVGAHPGDHDRGRRECDVLRAARAVVTTSSWTCRWVRAAYDLDPARLHVARPGVDPAPPVRGSAGGGRLLCVGAVLPAKGHDLLVAALAGLRHLGWRCLCVGPVTRDPAFARRVRQQVDEAGLHDRVMFAGPRTGAALDASYAASDLLVHASRAETYGMVVTEALARGLPVVAADTGGLPEALGVTADGTRPGLLVPSGDIAALATALTRWLTDERTRAGLRAAALQRRRELAGWPQTASRVADVLEQVAA